METNRKERKKMIFSTFLIAAITEKEKKMGNNPWDVPNLEEFLYYCCPECNHKIKGDIN